MSLPADFLDFSAVLGRNRLLVQGPGGNTSRKSDGVLSIKASGMELADAGDKAIFVDVDLAAARAEIDGTGDGSCVDTVLNKSIGLRPSIETTFHALLPHKFVFHYHSVNSLGHSSSVQGRTGMNEKLHGLNWAAVPYRKPGLELTLEIRKAMDAGSPDIFILENHGVIVGSDVVSDAVALVEDIENRLNLDATDHPLPQRGEPLPKIEGWNVADEFRSLAVEPKLRSRAVAGSYYPDHVVFLGPALPEISSDELGKLADVPSTIPAVVVRDRGVLVRTTANTSQRSMLLCLQDFLKRVPATWELIPIGSQAEHELLNWDAEKYRQKLSGASSGSR